MLKPRILLDLQMLRQSCGDVQCFYQEKEHWNRDLEATIDFGGSGPEQLTAP